MSALIEDKEQRKQALLQKIVTDIDRFLSRHSRKVFYAFAFDCSVYYGEILWAFNTEKALASSIKHYKEVDDEDEAALYDDKNGEMYLSLRYGIGEWKHNTESKAYYIFGDGDACEEMYEKAKKLDKENGSDNLNEEIMAFFEELLLAFCQTPTYQAIPKTEDFKILLSEHNDNEIDDTLPRSEKFMQRLNDLIDEPLDYQFPKIPNEARIILSEIDKQLFAAVRQGDNEEVKRLVAAGANVNAVEQKDKYKTLTPLHIAVDGNNLECARFLIEHGANVNAKDSRVGGWYPLRTAVYRSLEMMQLLLDGGADVNKSRALNCAISQGKMEIAEMLLSEYGANPNVIDVSETPLAEALRKYPDNHALIEMLLAHGADPNLGVKGLYTDGCIPIVRAVYKGIRKNVQLLIDAGANVNVATATRCVAGWTPLIWLMHCQDDGICDNDNRLEIAQCLIGAGADVNARDKDGKTVLDHVPESSRLMRQLLEDNGAKKSTA